VKEIISKFFWVIIIFSFIEFQPDSISGSLQRAHYNDLSDTLSFNSKPIAVVGDLQRTSVWEMMLGREQNDTERENIISEIKKEDPALLVLLGDMVFEGSDRKQWEYFDKVISPLNNLPILPVMGNHEYYTENSSGVREVKRRFPQVNSVSWYSRIYGNTALIFLDSNKPKLTPAQWTEQQIWYNEMISYLEEDPSIRSILVFTHHPPYTNSIVTGDERDIQNAFIKPFMQSEKTAAFFSGHAHTYEHFIKENKSFIVSGGGGGPRVILKKGEDCHIDQCRLSGIRPFHYVLIQPNKNSLEIIVKGINKGENKFFLVDNFKIEYSQNNIASK